MKREVLEQKIDKWCKDLTELEKTKYGDNEFLKKLCAGYYYPQYNKRWIKIVKARDEQNTQEYVFAFLDYDGNVYKPNGWAAPAKTVRGHIDNPPMRGSDLYIKGY